MKAVYQAISLGLMTAGVGLILLLLILVLSGQLFSTVTAAFGIAGIVLMVLGLLARQR